MDASSLSDGKVDAEQLLTLAAIAFGVVVGVIILLAAKAIFRRRALRPLEDGGEGLDLDGLEKMKSTGLLSDEELKHIRKSIAEKFLDNDGKAGRRRKATVPIAVILAQAEEEARAKAAAAREAEGAAPPEAPPAPPADISAEADWQPPTLSPEDGLAAVRALLDRQDWQGALEAATRLLKSRPQDSQVLEIIGRAYSQLGQPPAAPSPAEPAPDPQPLAPDPEPPAPSPCPMPESLIASGSYNQADLERLDPIEIDELFYVGAITEDEYEAIKKWRGIT